MHYSAVLRSHVGLSVTLVDCDHIGWKSWKLMTRTISPTPSLFVAQRRTWGNFWETKNLTKKTLLSLTLVRLCEHRCTSQGAEVWSPQTRVKPLFIGQKPNFSRRRHQPKMKKILLYLLNEKKTEFILSSEIKCPKSGIFTYRSNYGVGWVGQSNFAS